MKLKIRIISILLIVAFSCNKKLDIAPENTLVDKEVFKTQSGAEQALSEVYFNFLSAETNYFSYTFGDFTTPLLNKTAYYNTYDLGDATPTDGYVVNTWTDFFKAINSANNVIAKLPLYAKFPEASQNQFVAEAKFIRAFSFLNLLGYFGDGALTGNMSGPGLPLQLTPFEGYNTGEIIPRSTNGEVYAQIIKDLKEASDALPERFPDELKTRSRATKGAAFALLARTYLYMHDFENAAVYSKKVLDLEPSVYTLASNLLQLFPANPDGDPKSFSTEYIFGLPVSQMVSNRTSLTNGISGTYYFKRSYWINDEFINEFELGDLRLSQLIWKGDTIYNTNMLNAKTTFKFNNNFGRDNVPMIRLAEMILTRAEALANVSGVNEESVQLVNRIRKRSVPSAIDYLVSDFGSKQDLIDTILKQRKFELAFEGLHRYDLIRNQLPLHNPDIPANRKVLPVPQIEIDISNNVIQQNSGY